MIRCTIALRQTTDIKTYKHIKDTPDLLLCRTLVLLTQYIFFFPLASFSECLANNFTDEQSGIQTG